MKKMKLFAAALLSLCMMPAMAAGGDVVTVKLKSGATVSGELKSFDPLDRVVLVIAGQETTIPMDKVENVEVKKGTVASEASDQQVGDKKILVTDATDYPEKITVVLGDTPVEMLLVRGGKMNMGFDGQHSWAMKSEPVHEVEVTSFYMSATPLTQAALSGFGKTKHDDKGYAVVEKYKDVAAMMAAVASATGKPLRIPTEAEWEYAASCDLQNEFFGNVAGQEKIAYDWCSDYYDEFSKSSVGVDPTGPMRGSSRVIRAYNNKYGKLNRDNSISQGRYILGYVRLVIKAKDAR